MSCYTRQLHGEYVDSAFEINTHDTFSSIQSNLIIVYAEIHLNSMDVLICGHYDAELLISVSLKLINWDRMRRFGQKAVSEQYSTALAHHALPLN